MQHPSVVVPQFLDDMKTINRALYTREDQVSPLNFKLSKYKIEKAHERNINMANIMTQLGRFSKNVIR